MTLSTTAERHKFKGEHGNHLLLQFWASGVHESRHPCLICDGWELRPVDIREIVELDPDGYASGNHEHRIY